jgi:mono/diheme cytochrome c family protein
VQVFERNLKQTGCVRYSIPLPSIVSPFLSLYLSMKKSLLLALGFVAPALMSAQNIDYATQIQPIFNARCVGCHGGTAGLTLDSHANLMAGSNRGAVVSPGNANGSILYNKIRTDQNPPFGSRMPQGGSLSAEQITLIRDWINQGATATSSEVAAPAARFALHGNYPNPFNPTTTVAFTSEAAGMVSLEVFNILGQRISSRQLTAIAGRNTTSIDLSGSPSGMYFYRVTARQQNGQLRTLSGSMVLSK